MNGSLELIRKGVESMCEMLAKNKYVLLSAGLSTNYNAGQKLETAKEKDTW